MLAQYWDLIVTVMGPLLGLGGAWLWRGKRQATKVEIERWARVAADFVLSLMARGIIPVEESAVVAAWMERFRLLLELVGLSVGEKQLKMAKAVALERIGEVMLEREASKLGSEAEKMVKAIEEVMRRAAVDRRSPTSG